jgi:hypothetical protein
MKLMNNPDLRRHVENQMFKYIYGRVLAAGTEEVAVTPK